MGTWSAITARTLAVTTLVVVSAGIPARGHADDVVATETIVVMRHGEKPDAGLGQLNCQGLNRSLALPAVIARTFGKPDAIFAPDPAQRKADRGKLYDYIRPLATIEPTAIALGMPVNTGLGVMDIEGLANQLDQPAYRGALVLVAWEHHLAEDLARDLLHDHGGDGALVPKWQSEDFDSFYVVKIKRSGRNATATFEHRQQGLNGQPQRCPGQ
jgi:hypothetical protein